MRKRERENVIGKISGTADVRHGGPICVRAYGTDDKKLDEIARETGEGKAAIVRRMIRFALSDKQERFGADRCRERLDWLIENERQNGRQNGLGSDTLDERVGELQEWVATIESEVKVLSQKTSTFLRELYTMSSVSVSTMNIILSRLIQLATQSGADKEQCILIANRTMVEMIAYAVRDLERCAAFHGFGAYDEGAGDLYFAKRIETLQKDLGISQQSTPESEQRSR